MRNDDIRATGTAVASQIAPLKELKDYKVASDDPDVRGWKVLGRDGRKIGDVHDLLVDTAAMRVRYLDVELDRDLLGNLPPVPGVAHTGALMEHRHVLVPIGTARLDDHDEVFIESLDANDVAVLPPYDHQAFSRDYENGVRQRWDRNDAPPAPAPGAAYPDQNYYNGDLYDDERFYGPRRKKRGLFGR